MLGELQSYYTLHFPAELFYEWLSYGSKTLFHNRELSFTLHNDVYLRYLNFKNTDDLRLALRTQTPIKIDIGAVYNDQPRHKKIVKLVPKEKELVFDIDLSDYDDIRTCCEGATCCTICWEYIRIALKVISTGLQQDFGFNKLLFVYSGRRGVHIWVCDKKARALSDTVRSAILSYFTLVKGGQEMAKKVKLTRKGHPSIDRSIQIIKQSFMKVLQQQKTFENEQQLESLMLLIHKDKRETIKLKVQQATDLQEKWTLFIQGLDQIEIMEIMLQYTYPRLDIHVSTKMNHLLKAPFCVHPKTGRICLPIWDIDTFDPANCLTMVQVLNNPELIVKNVHQFKQFITTLQTEKHQNERKIVMTLKDEETMAF